MLDDRRSSEAVCATSANTISSAGV